MARPKQPRRFKQPKRRLQRRTKFQIAGAAALILLIVLYNLLELWVDVLWFAEVGQKSVLYRRLTWSLVIGSSAALLAFVIVLFNLMVARRIARNDTYVPFLVEVSQAAEALPKQPTLPDGLMRPISVAVALVIATIAGFSMSGNWVTVLSFLGRVDFGVNDPKFGRDASFYVFTIPFVDMIVGFVAGMIVISTIAVAALYFAMGVIRYEPVPRIARQAVVHLASLAAALLVLQAIEYRLRIWKLVSSEKGIAAGAGYTDLHARLPGFWAMIVASLAFAVLIVVFARRSRWRLLGFAGVSWLVLSVLTGAVIPGIVQSAIVKPNEIERERPVLRNNIKLTRFAYGLDKVAEEPFAGETGAGDLSPADLTKNKGTISNVRLWNPTTLRQALRQLQELRSFYQFMDVDVDRYMIDGQYRQAMLSVREIDPSQVQGTKTWVNQRLQYTHGYGLAGVWVNRATPQGLPDLFIKNIPPEYDTDLKVKQPAIYFGEQPDHYVIANTKQAEFDYPEGDVNHNVRYEGDGGIRVSGLARRLALSLRFGDTSMLLTRSITKDSRFMFRRNVVERVRQVAPFLDLDTDPYVVVLDGKLLWVIDGYTTSDRFPYSEHNQPQVVSGRINYVRNSVKATVDAYTGKVRLYAIDTKDPILQTWRKIFPKLFRSARDMPKGLAAHLRYPEDLFELQTEMWRTYHMRDPQVFYNKEDLWEVPEVGRAPLEPFYVLSRLPGEKDEEMVLMRPMTPAKKPNMIAWMGARMDPGHYGELVTYKLPKNKQVFGPAQIEARINQDSQISQQFTLWSGQGANVIRGNLLVFPIEQSLLYVQPIYLESDTTKLPELRRVIVAFGNTVAWGETLALALEELRAKRAGAADTDADTAKRNADESDGADEDAPSTPAETAAEDRTLEELSKAMTEASDHYEKALACQRSGDWECYGREIEAVGKQLNSE